MKYKYDGLDEPEVWNKPRWTRGMKTLDEPEVWKL